MAACAQQDSSGDAGGSGSGEESGDSGALDMGLPDVGDGDGDGDDDGGLFLPAGHPVNTGRVATADACVDCHSHSEAADAMHDEAGRNVGSYDLWQASMMANSARDPLWHAVVEAETIATPDAAAAIEGKCTRCHAPLLSAELQLTDAGLPEMAQLHEPDSDATSLALDGVSCTLCHQVEADGLGNDPSFSGGWLVAGEGRIYGPHADPFTMPMEQHTGMLPLEGAQLQDSALCGSCHTLFTDALDPAGQSTGHRLPEQTPYLEWRNSVFSTESAAPAPEAASCQDCHAPTTSVDGIPLETRMARRPMGDDFPSIDVRSPYGRHVFLGGNVTMLRVLRDWSDQLGTRATPAAFDASIEGTLEQLATTTADVAFGSIEREGEQLRIPVLVENRTGHKLPTGFPSRRVFLALEVRDASNQLVFASGQFDDRGRLLDAEGAVSPVESAGGPVSLHHDQIGEPGVTQVWEAVMADPDDQPTFRLMRAASYLRDDRLLPRGWDPMLATPDIAPRGVQGDADYESAGDTVTFLVEAPPGEGPYTMHATVYYQSLSPRFLAELLALDGPRIRQLEFMLEQADLGPSPLASASHTAP